MVEGIYTLQEWWIDGTAYAPPQVGGRFVLRDGCALTVLRDRRAVVARYSGTFIGTYRLDAATFAYGYEDVLTVANAADGVHIGEQVPWSGMREFALAADGDALCARAGAAEFRFSAAGFTYAEEGRVLRRWQRLGA